MAFTTWSALYDSMLDDLASGSWKIKSYQTANGGSSTYRDFKDFKEALEYARSQAAIDGGTVATRVYAKQGGRASS